MKLKEEYRNIDLKKICLENENAICNGNIPDEWLENFEEKKALLNKNNYFEIYVVLYLIADQCRELKTKLNIIGNWEEILDNIYITYPLLVGVNENYINIKIKDLDIKEEQLVIETEKTNYITDLLNEFCENWQDTFILKKREKRLCDFPGYNNVLLIHKELYIIIKYKAPEWENALKNVKGIYTITDISNGKIYIGSATEKNGIWQSWCSYANDLIGENETFIELIKNKGAEYIKNNFVYSILEIFDKETNNSYIKQREEFWKKVFQTEKFGMNK